MAETQTPQPEPTMTVKMKYVQWATAAVVLVIVGVVGQTALPSQAAQKPQAPTVTAAQKPKPVGPCDAKKGQEPVPARQKQLCAVVAAQGSYTWKQTETPKGTVVVAECREMAWDEHQESGRVAAQKYVTRCLVAEHSMWWGAQPKK